MHNPDPNTRIEPPIKLRPHNPGPITVDASADFDRKVVPHYGNGTLQNVSMEEILSSVHPPSVRRARDLAVKVKRFVGGFVYRRSEDGVVSMTTGAKIVVKRGDVGLEGKAISGAEARQICGKLRLPLCVRGSGHCR